MSTIRIQNIHSAVTRSAIEEHLGRDAVSAVSLAPSEDDRTVQVATVTFKDRGSFKESLKLGKVVVGEIWAGSQPSVDSDFRGLTVLCEGEDPVVEYALDGGHMSEAVANCLNPLWGTLYSIIAIHGLNGHAFGTWTYEHRRNGGGVMWLRDLLPQRVSNARILTYGYNANVVTNVSVSRIQEHARLLVQTLNRCQNPGRPVVFIAHSLGGLVVKQALLFIRNGSEYPDLESRSFSIIFLGTPHRGSRTAELGDIVAKISGIGLVGWAHSLKFLKPKARNLHDLELDFRPLHDQLAQVVSFCEQKPMAGLGLIVDEQSAALGLQHERIIPVNADHSTICKFPDGGNEIYKLVLDEVKRCVRETPRKKITAVTQRLHFCVPYAQHQKLTPRCKIFERLDSYLLPQGHQQPRVTLHGLGGAGKTEIAIEYAHRMAKTQSVLWVDASTDKTFKIDYGKIADVVGLPTINGQSQLENVKRFLECNDSGDWLLVVDGANNLELCSLLNAYLPVRKGKILFTTRNSWLHEKVATNPGSAIEVGEMNELEAKQMLKSLTMLSDEQVGSQDTRKLLALLGYLPLAISTACSYILQNQIMVCEYNLMFEESNRTRETLLVQSAKRPGVERLDQQTDYASHAIITTWDVSFEDIQSKNQTAACLFRLLACLDPQEIPKNWLRSEPLSKYFGDKARFNNAFGLLRSYSLVGFSQESQHCHLHPLVSIWAHARMTDSERNQWTNTSTEMICHLFPEPNLTNMSECRAILRHAYAVERHAIDENLEHISLSKLLYKMARHLRFDGFYALAMEYAQKSKTMFEKQLGVECEETLACIHLLGGCASFRSQHQEALRWYELALVGRKNLLGENDPSTLATLNNIGTVFDTQGHYGLALDHYTQALGGRQKVLGSDDPETLATCNNIGVVYHKLGRLEEAHDWLDQALKGREKVLGSEHPSTLSTLNNMALLFDKMGETEKALDLFQRALAGREKCLGRNHPSTLATENNIAQVFQNRGCYQQALDYYHRALDGRKLVLGPEHPATLATINNIGKMLYMQGRSIEALRYYLSALSGREKALGETHPSTVATVDNILDLFEKRKDGNDATQWCADSVEVIKNTLGDEHSIARWARESLQ